MRGVSGCHGVRGSGLWRGEGVVSLVSPTCTEEPAAGDKVLGFILSCCHIGGVCMMVTMIWFYHVK